jgi:DNA-binding PadR family transcriptional regulator
MLIIHGFRSNWEVVAFYLIEPLVSERNRRFSRSAIMKDATELYPLLRILGHKKDPSSPEQTLQKTLQNMRDKKWIYFLGGGYTGEYELTDEGYKTLLSIRDSLSLLRKSRNEINCLFR